MFVKPAIEGAMIRIPERDMRPMLAEGEDVAENSFWFRRILFGDVVKAKHAATLNPTESSKKYKEIK